MGTFNLSHVLTHLPSFCPVVEKPDKIVGISFSVMFLLQTIFQPFLYFITVYDTPLSDYFQSIMSALFSEEMAGEWNVRSYQVQFPLRTLKYKGF